jgi:hypothetical protein
VHDSFILFDEVAETCRLLTALGALGEFQQKLFSSLNQCGGGAERLNHGLCHKRRLARLWTRALEWFALAPWASRYFGFIGFSKQPSLATFMPIDFANARSIQPQTIGDKQQSRRHSAWISYKLRLLRAHAQITNFVGTHRQRNDIEALHQVHPMPQVSETPLTPVRLPPREKFRASGRMYCAVTFIKETPHHPLRLPIIVSQDFATANSTRVPRNILVGREVIGVKANDDETVSCDCDGVVASWGLMVPSRNQGFLR